MNPGERWVLFLGRLPSVDGEPVQELTVIRTWRITSDGLVVTGDGKRISLDEFEG